MKKTMGVILFLVAFAGVVWAHEGHEHASNIPTQIEWGLKGAQEAINIHPLFVHFPIALLLGSVAFYFLGSLFKKVDLLAAGKWALYFGTVSAAVTVWTGLEAAKTVPHGTDVHEIMMIHQYFGFVVLGLSLVLSAWVFFSKSPVPVKGRILFLMGLVLLALVLTQGADFGGRMVFLHGVGMGRKSMLHQEKAHSQTPEEGHREQPGVSEVTYIQDTPSATWHEIKEHETHLSETIETGKLDEVHEIAFTIRDLSKTLAEKSTDLSREQMTKVKSSVEKIAEVAALLDEYGDAGDKVKTQEQFERLKELLRWIEMQYPAGYLKET